ncbi:hypothetical protein KFE25_008809 [Diacronema lutheri]|uniref:La-related protein 7 n=1 Tax=Diacronema lutheri TaxID=2081491 RepID=A0A8J5XLS7_DIALT|nr:hypothetical protein KFE25_008809 [Diacronema lutheri]
MASALPAEAREALVRQLRFYFSDANLRRDKFLQSKLGADGRQWMEVAVLASFNRVASRTRDVGQIAGALAELAEVELDAGRARVRRLEPVAPASLEATDARTVYVENLPRAVEQMRLGQLLEAAVGPVSFVALPRFEWPESRPAKGYAFVEFVHERDAARAPGAVVLMGALTDTAAAEQGVAGRAEPPPPRRLTIMPKREWLALRDEYAARASAQLEWVGAQRDAARLRHLPQQQQQQQQQHGGEDGGIAAGAAMEDGSAALTAAAAAERRGYLVRVDRIPAHASRPALVRVITEACAQAARAHAQAARARAAAPPPGGAAAPAAAPAEAEGVRIAPEYVDFPKAAEPAVGYARFLLESSARSCALALRGCVIDEDGVHLDRADETVNAELGLGAELLSMDAAVEYWRKVNLERAQRWLALQRKRGLPADSHDDQPRAQRTAGAGGRGAARGRGERGRGEQRGRGGGARGRSVGGRGAARGAGPGVNHGPDAQSQVHVRFDEN